MIVIYDSRCDEVNSSIYKSCTKMDLPKGIGVVLSRGGFVPVLHTKSIESRDTKPRRENSPSIQVPGL